jgi:hypothetical protein
MDSNEAVTQGGNSNSRPDSAAALKPKDAVLRILRAAGAEVSDKEAFWLGHHMERFVNHTRKHGELLEFPLAVEVYTTFFRQGNPADWQLDQLKQALVLFGRGTERWRWVGGRRAEGRWVGEPEGGSRRVGGRKPEGRRPEGRTTGRGYIAIFALRASSPLGLSLLRWLVG